MENQPVQTAPEEPKVSVETATVPATPTQPTPPIQAISSAATSEAPKQESLSRKINKAMAIVLIVSAISFVLISILAIWEVFGANAGEVVGRSLGSLGAIALGALIISVASKLIDDRSHS